MPALPGLERNCLLFSTLARRGSAEDDQDGGAATMGQIPRMRCHVSHEAKRVGSSCLQARNEHIKGPVEHVSALPWHVQGEPIL